MRRIVDHAVAGTKATLSLYQGDLTQADVNAIVNAANSGLLGGGGVDGAIHRRGGPEILDACRRIRTTDYPDGLPTGQAVITTGGRLTARFVIHTVGPVYSRKPGVPALLEACHVSSLALARAHDLASVAFPAISTGVYGYPLGEAAPIALGTVARILSTEAGRGSVRDVRFVLFDGAAVDAFSAALAGLVRTP